MGEPFDRTALANCLARSYRVGWQDAGILLDHFREHGESVLLIVDRARTDARWLCAWRTTAGTLARHDDCPWRAVRLVAEAALHLPVPWPEPENLAALADPPTAPAFQLQP